MGDKHFAGGSFAHGSWSLDYKSGQVVATVTYDSDELAGSVSLVIKAKGGLEELKKLIPGTIDDAIISVIETALGV